MNEYLDHESRGDTEADVVETPVNETVAASEEKTDQAVEAVKEPSDESGSDTQESDTELADLLKKIETLQVELTAKQDDQLRHRAEMDNFRKRVQRDKDELRKTANVGLIEELLPVIDNMQLGLQSAEQNEEAKGIVQGFTMVLTLLRSTLSNHGLVEINPEGSPFDPNLHDCVSQQVSEVVAEDHVIQVIRSGYTLNGRLVRAANVIVSSGKAKEEGGEATCSDEKEVREASQ